MIKLNSNLPPDEASLNPHCFCYCRQPVENTIIAYIVVMAIFSPIHSGKYIRIVLPHHSGIILIMPLGCVDLLRSIDRAQSLSLVLVRIMPGTYFRRPKCRI
jgi:hypothetical protein